MGEDGELKRKSKLQLISTDTWDISDDLSSYSDIANILQVIGISQELSSNTIPRPRTPSLSWRMSRRSQRRRWDNILLIWQRKRRRGSGTPGLMKCGVKYQPDTLPPPLTWLTSRLTPRLRTWWTLPSSTARHSNSTARPSVLNWRRVAFSQTLMDPTSSTTSY